MEAATSLLGDLLWITIQIHPRLPAVWSVNAMYFTLPFVCVGTLSC
jgi:hypothetical protein